MIKLSNLPFIVGVAPNAFSRVVPASFLENYSIVCLKNRGETEYVKKEVKVIVAEELFPDDAKLSKQSTMAILKIPGVVKYINSLKDPHILIYKPMPALERYCGDQGWKLIANRFEIRDRLENKKNFRELLIESGANAIVGEVFGVEQFSDSFYKYLTGKFGTKLVFQIAEMTGGGGIGTSFINSLKDYRNFLAKLEGYKKGDTQIAHVNVTRYIEGVPASIISVATSKGTITGTLQAQIQDVDLVNDPSKGSGLYCGHDWEFFSNNENVINKAKDIAKKFGDYISKKIGYRGLFGLDVLVDTINGEVYPVECNPRYTDLFPVISMNCLASGITPFDYYHILAFVNPSLIGDTEKISAGYKYLSPASQLVLSTKTRRHTIVNGNLKAGVYKFDETGKIIFDRGGYRFEDLKNPDEFLITEGVPFPKMELGYEARICRLVFKTGILQSKNKLKPIYELVIKNIYKLIDLQEI